MRVALKLHPDFQCEGVAAIDAEAERRAPAILVLGYSLAGSIGELALPAAEPAVRSDGLWEHSCFEAFLREPGGSAYHEFNFAPSRRWAAYRFSGYREGMAAADIAPPEIAIRRDERSFEMRVSLDLAPLSLADWEIGLSAVIEERCGRKSYWASRHPPGKADFHHPESFALSLPRA